MNKPYIRKGEHSGMWCVYFPNGQFDMRSRWENALWIANNWWAFNTCIP